ncbi:MAG TPA: hypothetical protein VJ652_00140 [Noviherbaspirillum sp.]|nr:hypothetical protein [Noviherbaspirillum sp.]
MNKQVLYAIAVQNVVKMRSHAGSLRRFAGWPSKRPSMTLVRWLHFILSVRKVVA